MYAVYQSGYAIFGVGMTIEAAITDAMEWLDADTDPEEIEAISHQHGEVNGTLYVRQCSARLAEAVKAEGGDIDYDVDADGILRLEEELEEDEA